MLLFLKIRNRLLILVHSKFLLSPFCRRPRVYGYKKVECKILHSTFLLSLYLFSLKNDFISSAASAAHTPASTVVFGCRTSGAKRR